MRQEAASNKKHIVATLDPTELLVPSKLIHLSNLNESDLDFLKQSWAITSTERRRQVISQLVKLSQTNFRVNFSEIFFYCLYDPDAQVRTEAVAGLADEENYRHISPLIQLLARDSSAEVKEAAVVALGKFAVLGEMGKLSDASTNEVYQALLAVLDDKSAGSELQCLALEAIAPLNLPRVPDLIKAAYRSKGSERKLCALRAMGRNCYEPWLSILVRELDSDNAEVRYEAAHAISELGAEEALPYLVRLSADKDSRVQESAIRGLAEIGSEEARQALNKLASSPQQRVSQAARAALKELIFDEEPLPFGS